MAPIPCQAKTRRRGADHSLPATILPQYSLLLLSRRIMNRANCRWLASCLRYNVGYCAASFWIMRIFAPHGTAHLAVVVDAGWGSRRWIPMSGHRRDTCAYREPTLPCGYTPAPSLTPPVAGLCRHAIDHRQNASPGVIGASSGGRHCCYETAVGSLMCLGQVHNPLDNGQACYGRGAPAGRDGTPLAVGEATLARSVLPAGASGRTNCFSTARPPGMRACIPRQDGRGRAGFRRALCYAGYAGSIRRFHH